MGQGVRMGEILIATSVAVHAAANARQRATTRCQSIRGKTESAPLSGLFRDMNHCPPKNETTRDSRAVSTLLEVDARQRSRFSAIVRSRRCCWAGDAAVGSGRQGTTRHLMSDTPVVFICAP